MFLHDAALRVKEKRSGKRRDAAVLDAHVVGSDGDRIVDAKLLDEVVDGVEIVIVNDQADDLEAVFVFGLQLDEVRDFGAARSAPGGPEIQQDGFPAKVGRRDGLAVETRDLKSRGGIGIANEIDRGLVLFGGGLRSAMIPCKGEAGAGKKYE